MRAVISITVDGMRAVNVVCVQTAKLVIVVGYSPVHCKFSL